MENLEIKSKKAPPEIRSHLIQFFGPGGLGLAVVEETDQCLRFEGGGGFVDAVICPGTHRNSRVEITSREWERQVRRFAATLK